MLMLMLKMFIFAENFIIPKYNAVLNSGSFSVRWINALFSYVIILLKGLNIDSLSHIFLQVIHLQVKYTAPNYWNT